MSHQRANSYVDAAEDPDSCPSPRRVLLAWVDQKEGGGEGERLSPRSAARRRSSHPNSACLLWPYLRPECQDPRVPQWVGNTNALLRGAMVATVFTQDQFGEMLRAFTTLQEGSGRLARVHAGKDALWDSILVVGDLHGQRADLVGAVLGPFLAGQKAAHLLFLGDFVDRGPDGAEVVAIIMLLKILYPSWITLVRGNHEEPSVTQVYGYARELDAKFPREDAGGFPGMGGFGMSPHPLWTASHDAFAHVPVAAVLESHSGKKVFFCHGGLAPPLLESPVEEVVPSIPPLVDACPLIREGTGDDEAGTSERDQQLLNGLLWSDPVDELEPAECEDGMEPNQRGCGWIWAPEATRKFLAINDYEWMCRAHQCIKEGYQWAHDEKVLTVFTASNYCGLSMNLGAVLSITVDESGSIMHELKTHTSDSVAHAIPQSNSASGYFNTPDVPSAGPATRIPSEFSPILLPLDEGSAEEQAARLRGDKAEGKVSEGAPVELMEAALELCGAGGTGARWQYTDDAGTDESADYCFEFRVEGRQVVGGSLEKGAPIEGSRLVVCMLQESVEADGSEIPDLVIVEGENTYRGQIDGDRMKGRWHSAEDGSCGDFALCRIVD